MKCAHCGQDAVGFVELLPAIENASLILIAVCKTHLEQHIIERQKTKR